MSLALLQTTRLVIAALERVDPLIASRAGDADRPALKPDAPRSMKTRPISALLHHERPLVCLAAVVMGAHGLPFWPCLALAAPFAARHFLASIAVLSAPRGRMTPIERSRMAWNTGQAGLSLFVYAWIAWFFGLKVGPLLEGFQITIA